VDKMKSEKRNMKVTAAALLVVSAGLSGSAQAEMLALRCEGTKIVREIKEPTNLKEVFPGFPREDDKGTKDARTEERALTDVIVAGQRVHAFGVEFEEGASNEAFVHFFSH
jgi:hypothetical protein